MALLSTRHREMSLLIDLVGDVPAVLGIAEPPGPGVHDWVARSMAPPSALAAIAVTVNDNLRVVPCGSLIAPPDHPRWAVLAEYLADLDTDVFVDASTTPPPPGLLQEATQNLLVIRQCYIGLRRAAASSIRPSAVIVVHEAGRALTVDDVSAALNAPVVGQVTVDPQVARVIDAGLLLRRMPRALSLGLREVAA
ncbi:MAG: hypothetical protein ABIR32_17065 [Ilumatobacteraceae bacterium]